jgi:hypothetical protein
MYIMSKDILPTVCLKLSGFISGGGKEEELRAEDELRTEELELRADELELRTEELESPDELDDTVASSGAEEEDSCPSPGDPHPTSPSKEELIPPAPGAVSPPPELEEDEPNSPVSGGFPSRIPLGLLQAAKKNATAAIAERAEGITRFMIWFINTSYLLATARRARCWYKCRMAFFSHAGIH